MSATAVGELCATAQRRLLIRLVGRRLVRRRGSEPTDTRADSPKCVRPISKYSQTLRVPRTHTVLLPLRSVPRRADSRLVWCQARRQKRRPSSRRCGRPATSPDPSASHAPPIVPRCLSSTTPPPTVEQAVASHQPCHPPLRASVQLCSSCDVSDSSHDKSPRRFARLVFYHSSNR